MVSIKWRVVFDLSLTGPSRPLGIRQFEEDRSLPLAGWKVCYSQSFGSGMAHSYSFLSKSFSELMPIVLNVLLGVPQMLSNIQCVLILLHPPITYI